MTHSSQGPKASRRMFLRGAGGATLSIPFLSSLSKPSAAHASADGVPRRLIAIKSYSTQNIPDWYPTFVGNGYSLRTGNAADGTTALNEQIPGTPYHQAPLSDFAAEGISPILDTAFNPYLDRMNLLRGLDFLPDTNHNDGGMLGNFAGSGSEFGSTLPHVPTIDQVLAYSDRFYEDSPILRSLHMAPGDPNTCSFTDNGIAGGAVQQVQGHVDPLTAFNALFNAPGVMPPGDDGGELTFDPNVKLVDRVYSDYVRRREHPRLSTLDRELLERHISFLSELQDNLMGGGGVPCTFPDEPGSYPEMFSLDVMDVGQAYSLMIDVMIAGIICDHSRVATLDVRKALSDGRGDTWAGYYHGADGPSTWHGDAHAWGNPDADYNLLRLNHWIAHDIFLKIIERLDVIESGSTTYLDNSLVYWGNELGFNHLNYSVPAVTAGGAGGCIRTGNYLDYIEWDSQVYFSQNGGHVMRGIPHNQMLVSVMQAMGLSPADYEMNGQPGYGSIETVGKSANTHAVDYDFARIGDPLPNYTV
ncbi:MAG: DUF1552 domain-containing protein [Myxococcota bacterium]